MLKTIYEVKVYHEDYFDHFRSSEPKPEVHQFDTLQEAWNFYSTSRTYDYNWPRDHSRTTSRIHKKTVFVVDVQPKHGYVRGYRRNYTRDTEFIERQYLNKPWFKKNYECDKNWLSFYTQPAFTPCEVLCHRIHKEECQQIIVECDCFDAYEDNDPDLPF